MVVHTEMELLVGGICRAQFQNIFQRCPNGPTTKSGVREGRRRSPGSIEESFNGASLSKIVSYMAIEPRASVFGEFEHGENGDRERMAWLAFANPAARSPELFSTAAPCLPATIIAAISM